MSTVQEQIDAFKQLNYQEKYDIVFGMITELKDTNQNYKYIYETLPTLDPNEQLLDNLYEDLTKLWEEKKDAIKDIETEKISKMADYIRKIHDMEAEERAKENPDDVLKKIQ